MLRISNIDLAAAITTSTGLQPEISNYPAGQLQAFFFPDDSEVVSVITRYSTGELSLPAQRLLACRSSLYRMIRTHGGRTAVPQLRGVFDHESRTAVVVLAGEVRS